MRYAILIYEDPERRQRLSESEREADYAEYVAIGGLPQCVGGAQLQPTHTASTVRVDGGQTLVTDGPFANTKEVFGGFYLLEVEDIDAALEVAARIPAARRGGCAEVRAVVER
jgi:hypothetical protein